LENLTNSSQWCLVLSDIIVVSKLSIVCPLLDHVIPSTTRGI